MFLSRSIRTLISCTDRTRFVSCGNWSNLCRVAKNTGRGVNEPTLFTPLTNVLTKDKQSKSASSIIIRTRFSNNWSNRHRSRL